MHRIVKLAALVLAVICMLGYIVHRGAAQSAQLALHDSAHRAGAYVHLARAKHIQVNLPSGVPSGGSINAFDTVASPSMDHGVADCLAGTWPWAAQASCKKPGGISAAIRRAVQPSLITAVFPDASTRTYALDAASGHYLPVPGSARDDFGNGIPETVAMVSNGGGIDTYVFRGAEAIRNRTLLVRQLLALGIAGNYANGTGNEPITCAKRRVETVCLRGLGSGTQTDAPVQQP